MLTDLAVLFACLFVSYCLAWWLGNHILSMHSYWQVEFQFGYSPAIAIAPYPGWPSTSSRGKPGYDASYGHLTTMTHIDLFPSIAGPEVVQKCGFIQVHQGAWRGEGSGLRPHSREVQWSIQHSVS